MNIDNLIKKAANIKELPEQSQKVRVWLSWYANRVPGFHEYKLRHNNKTLDRHRKSMSMAKSVCETWARVLLNEKCDIVIPDNDKPLLDKTLNELNFWHIANGAIEKAFALGTGALVLGIEDLEIGDKGTIRTNGAKPTIDFINAMKIYPLRINHGVVTECAFASVEGDTTTVVVHRKGDNGNYFIDNFIYVKDNEEPVNQWTFDTKSNIAWFFLISPALESNYINENGEVTERHISIFGNAIDTLMSIDERYDEFDWEFKANKTRIYLSEESLDNHEQQKGEVPFDLDQSYFIKLPDADPTSNETGPYVNPQSTPIRAQEFIDGINKELSILAYKVGLGENYFNFNGTALMTATQVISEKSTMYGNVKKHEIPLETMLINFTQALIGACNNFTDIKFSQINKEDISVKFDDSIFEDTDTQKKADKEDVSAGIMSPIEYRMKWYGEDEDSANKNYARLFTYNLLDKYASSFTQGLMTPSDFVEKVYPFAINKAEIIKYLEENKNSGEYDLNEIYLDGKDGEDNNNEVEDNETDDTKKRDE